MKAAPRPRGPAVDAVAAAALGALQTLAYVHTAVPGAWLLPLATLAWLVWRLDGPPPRPPPQRGAR